MGLTIVGFSYIPFLFFLSFTEYFTGWTLENLQTELQGLDSVRLRVLGIDQVTEKIKLDLNPSRLNIFLETPNNFQDSQQQESFQFIKENPDMAWIKSFYWG